jgi:hypothetical protein
VTADDMVRNIMMRHPSKNNNGAIVGDLKEFFSKLSSDNRERLLEYYKSHYEKESMPRISFFRKASHELNIGFGKKQNYVFKCDVCGAKYSRVSKGCPKCRSMTDVYILEYDNYPQDTIKVQEACFMCGIYSQYAIGPVCEYYGKTPDNPTICKDCQCRECCHDERLYRNDPEGYQRKLDKGEVFNPVNAKVVK